MAAAYPGKLRRIEDPRALDMLLAAVPGRDGLRTVGKQGVRIDEAFYLAPTVMPGTTVLARMDLADLGRAFLFDPQGGQFLGEAHGPSILGVDPAEAVARAKAAQKALLEEGTAEIRRAARRIRPRDMVEAILRPPPGNLIAFPRPAEAHATPEIAAALEAATHRGCVKTPCCATFSGALEGSNGPFHRRLRAAPSASSGGLRRRLCRRGEPGPSDRRLRR